MRQHDDIRKYSFRKIWQYSLRKILYLRLQEDRKQHYFRKTSFWDNKKTSGNILSIAMNGLGMLVLFSLNRGACHCWHATLFAHADLIHQQQCEHFYISQQQSFCHTMLTTILPAATVPALYHTITTATGLYSKELLFILYFYFLLTTVWGWKYLFFSFEPIRKGPLWMVIAKYRNCAFSKGMKLIDTIYAWHGIRAANKSICTQFQSHPSFSCKILIGGNANNDFPLQEEIKICKLI